MGSYPRILKYNSWLVEYIFKLPNNKILRVMYAPFYALIYFLVTFTFGFVFFLFYIILLPIYITYVIIYHIKKENLSKTELHITLYDNKIQRIKIKNIKIPKREGFIFEGWELKDQTPVTKLWELSEGTKVYAKWKELNISSKIISEENLPKNQKKKEVNLKYKETIVNYEKEKVSS